MRATCQTIRRAAGVSAMLLSLSCSDSTGPAGPKVGAVSVTTSLSVLEIGDTVRLVATVLDEGGVIMSGHSLTWRSSNAAVASVDGSGLVSGRSAGETHVRIAIGALSDSVLISVRPGACAIASATGTISVGQSRTGSYTVNDCLFEGQPADGWRLDLASPTVVNINLTSPSDPGQLIVTDMQLNVVTYGIGNGATSQAILFLPPGSYLLWTASTGSTLSDYQLAVQVHQTTPCSTAAGTIEVGLSIGGQIDGNDCLFLSDHYADSWQLSLTAQTTLQIDLTSTDFDPVVLVTNAAGQWLAFNDDANGSLNPQLVITLPAGDYLVVASTYVPLTSGSYVLGVHPSGGASPRVARSSVSASRRLGRPASADSAPGAWPVAGK